MRLTSFITLSAALLVSTTAIAKTKAPVEPEQSPTEKAATVDKKICKRLATSGTRMAERVCLTKQEWEQVEQQAK